AVASVGASPSGGKSRGPQGQAIIPASCLVARRGGRLESLACSRRLQSADDHGPGRRGDPGPGRIQPGGGHVGGGVPLGLARLKATPGEEGFALLEGEQGIKPSNGHETTLLFDISISSGHQQEPRPPCRPVRSDWALGYETWQGRV